MFRFVKNLQRSLDRFGRRLSKLGAAVVWPFERTAKMIGEGFIAASEWFENLAGNLGQILAWPFLAIWKSLTTFTRVLLPKSLRNAIAAPFVSIGRLLARFGQTAVRIAEAINLDKPILWLVWLLQPIWRPIVGAGRFFQAWFVTRKVKQAIWGIPALVMFLPFALIMVKTLVFGNAGIAGQYRVAIKKALETEDYEQAQLYERKLVQLGVDTKRTDYRSALSLAEQGKLSEAYQRMQRLAPEESPSYAAAHFWIARQLLSGALDELETDRAERLRLTEIHLQHIDHLGFKGPDFQMMRSYLLLQNNRPAEAAEVLKPLVVRFLDAAIQRMRIHITLNKLNLARKDARSVRTHLEKHQRESLPISAEQYRWWSVAEELAGDELKFKSILRRWQEDHPDDTQPEKLLADVSRRQFLKVLESAHPRAEVLTELFLTSAEQGTDTQRLRIMAGDIYARQSQLPVAKKVVEQLAQSPRTPASVCEALGAAAAQAGNYEQAMHLLQQAIAANPDYAIAWNNLAWVLSHRTPPDFDEALSAANKAIELAPKEYNFRETRGQILISQQRWNDAIADLEFALNGLPESADIHRALAKAYDATGEEELARIHRQQIE